jgi:hypothetical protein
MAPQPARDTSAVMVAAAGLAGLGLAGLGLLGIGLDRALRRLAADLRHTRARLDDLRGQVDDRRTDQLVISQVDGLERATARLEAAVGALAAAAGGERADRHRGLDRIGERVDGLERELKQVARDVEEVAREVERAAREVERAAREVGAEADLRALVEPRAPMPPLGGWALDADTLHAVATMMWLRRPPLIVECGSGSSSVWLGYLAERLGTGRVVSLEHDERFLHATRALVAAHGLRDRVEIRHAPLEPWAGGDGQPYPWYQRSAIDDLAGIGLLLVDGPPGAVGRQARYPAGPLLIPRCAVDAVIVLDDTDRVGERAVSDRWQEEWPDLERQPRNRPAPAHVFVRRAGRGVVGGPIGGTAGGTAGGTVSG